MKRRIFFDTNVLLDVLTRREPFFDHAAALWAMAERRQIDGMVSAMSLPTVYYLLRRIAGHAKATKAIKGIREVFDIVPLDREMIDQALDGGFDDLEDGIQACAAQRAEAQCIVTRDPKGFRRSQVPAIAPDKLIASFTNPQTSRDEP